MTTLNQAQEQAESDCCTVCGSCDCQPAPTRTPVTDENLILLESGDVIQSCDGEGVVPACVSRSLELELRSTQEWEKRYEELIVEMTNEANASAKTMIEQRREIKQLTETLEETTKEKEQLDEDMFWIQFAIIACGCFVAATGHWGLALLIWILWILY